MCKRDFFVCHFFFFIAIGVNELLYVWHNIDPIKTDEWFLLFIIITNYEFQNYYNNFTIIK